MKTEVSKTSRRLNGELSCGLACLKRANPRVPVASAEDVKPSTIALFMLNVVEDDPLGMENQAISIAYNCAVAMVVEC